MISTVDNIVILYYSEITTGMLQLTDIILNFSKVK
jgi:hypothetical protein